MHRISVVRGYQRQAIDLPDIDCVDNDDFETTGEIVSLQCALEAHADQHDTFVCYGDVLFRKFVAAMLAEIDDDVVMVVDTTWQPSVRRVGPETT